VEGSSGSCDSLEGAEQDEDDLSLGDVALASADIVVDNSRLQDLVVEVQLAALELGDLRAVADLAVVDLLDVEMNLLDLLDAALNVDDVIETLV